MLTQAATPAQLPDWAVVVGTAVVLCAVVVGGALVGAVGTELVETVTGTEVEPPPEPCLIKFLIAASYRSFATVKKKWTS